MRKMIFPAIVFFISFLSVRSAHAVEFEPVGPEQMSMGGAGVASATGAYAPYYNPALLAESDFKGEFGFAIGAAIRELDLSTKIDKLSSMDLSKSFQVLSGKSGTASKQDVDNALNNVNDAVTVITSLEGVNGFQVMPAFNLGFQIKNYGFGIYTVSEATATAIVDPQYTSIIVKDDSDPNNIQYLKYINNNDLPTTTTREDYEQHSLEYALNNKKSYIDLTGLAYAEVPFSYAHQFPLTWGKLDVGGSIKIMPGYTYDQNIEVDTDSKDTSKDLTETKKQSISWGIDLGVLFKPEKVENLSIGLVAKNLNTPKFRTGEGNYLKVKPQVRFGAAYDFMRNNLTAALDFDITENNTFIPGFYSQYVGAGINYHPSSWFSVRCGLMDNIRDSYEGIDWTVGFGIGVKKFQVDLSGLCSTRMSEYRGDKVPGYAKVLLSIMSRW